MLVNNLINRELKKVHGYLIIEIFDYFKTFKIDSRQKTLSLFLPFLRRNFWFKW